MKFFIKTESKQYLLCFVSADNSKAYYLLNTADTSCAALLQGPWQSTADNLALMGLGVADGRQSRHQRGVELLD